MLLVKLAWCLVLEAGGVRVEHVSYGSAPTKVTLEELPDCPCTIYDGFCSRRDLTHLGWGVACVASEDALVTMPWQVQCVPVRNGGIEYRCPPLLPLKCNPSQVQDPCDTSGLAVCDAGVCGKNRKLKEFARRPRHCSFDSCTESECCNVCECGKDRDPTCCQGREADDEDDGKVAVTCSEKIQQLSAPTTARLRAYSEECGFGTADVDYGSVKFALTPPGAAKICSEKCQSSKELEDAPLNVFGDAQELGTECDEAALHSQLSPVGVFAAAGVLDELWRNCDSKATTDFVPAGGGKLDE